MEQREVLTYLRKKRVWMRTKDIARDLGNNQSSVGYNIKMLLRFGFVEFKDIQILVGSGSGGAMVSKPIRHYRYRYYRYKKQEASS